MKKFDPELFNLNLEIIIRTPQRRIAIRFTLTKVISALVKSGEINRVQALCMAAVAPLRWLDVIGLNRSADLGPMGSDQTEFVMKYGVFGER